MRLAELIRTRRSQRGAYAADRPVSRAELAAICEAARWAPTAHNMQNFELLIVDRAELLAAAGAIPVRSTVEFLAENYAQLHGSIEELQRTGTGLLSTMFPPAWLTPSQFGAACEQATPLAHSLQAAPCLILVLFDPRRRAPASSGDRLGFMSLGCVLENMWLTAHALGLSCQILSVLSSADCEAPLRQLLSIPAELEVAFAMRLGHALPADDYVRVRRDPAAGVHWNRYGAGPSER